MENRNEQRRSGFMLTSITATFIAVAVGLLLIVIGVGTRNEGVTLAGTFILPLALIWGGFFLEEQSLPVKVTLLAIGGLIIVALIRSLM